MHPAVYSRAAMGRTLARLGLSGREALLLGTAIALAVVVRLASLALTDGHALAGDQLEYDLQGRLFADGLAWWSTTPFGELHPSLWKAPLYTAWVGLWYWLLGPDPQLVMGVQALAVTPVTVSLTFALARRLFGAGAAVAAAFLVAVYPLAWQFEVRLYSEALAVPLGLAVLLLVLERRPTRRTVVTTGVLVGLAILVRPSSGFLLAGVLVAWIAAAGWRRGAALTAATVAVAALCVAPWTIRNAVVDGGFVPVSVQSGALYCTFNELSATSEDFPYACRIRTPAAERLLRTPTSDSEFQENLQQLAFDYIAENPASVPQAFFWNGIVRLWDLRDPSLALVEVPFEGRSVGATQLGLLMYYPLLGLALVALWRHRARRALVLPVLALALAASIVYTGASGTRYRAPLEPLIVVLACSTPFVARSARRLT